MMAGVMAGWICPACRRRFGRLNQSHECAPAMSLRSISRPVCPTSGPCLPRFAALTRRHDVDRRGRPMAHPSIRTVGRGRRYRALP